MAYRDGISVADIQAAIRGDLFNAPGLPIQYSARPGQTFGVHATQNARPFDSIVAHHTGGSTLQSALNAQRDPFTGQTRGYHFYIDRDGTIVQGAPLDARTNHVQPPSSSQRIDRDDISNSNAIGIAYVGKSSNPTPQQQASAETLTRSLMERYNISSQNVVGHGQIQRSREAGEGMPLVEAMQRQPSPTMVARNEPPRPAQPAAQPEQPEPLLQEARWQTPEQLQQQAQSSLSNLLGGSPTKVGAGSEMANGAPSFDEAGMSGFARPVGPSPNEIVQQRSPADYNSVATLPRTEAFSDASRVMDRSGAGIFAGHTWPDIQNVHPANGAYSLGQFPQSVFAQGQTPQASFPSLTALLGGQETTPPANAAPGRLTSADIFAQPEIPKITVNPQPRSPAPTQAPQQSAPPIQQSLEPRAPSAGSSQSASIPLPQPRPFDLGRDAFASRVWSTNPTLDPSSPQAFNMQEAAIKQGYAPWAPELGRGPNAPSLPQASSGVGGGPDMFRAMANTPAGGGNFLQQGMSSPFGMFGGGGNGSGGNSQPGPFDGMARDIIQGLKKFVGETSPTDSSFRPENSFASNVPDSGPSGIMQQAQEMTGMPGMGSNPLASLFGGNGFGGMSQLAQLFGDGTLPMMDMPMEMAMAPMSMPDFGGGFGGVDFGFIA